MNLLSSEIPREISVFLKLFLDMQLLLCYMRPPLTLYLCYIVTGRHVYIISYTVTLFLICRLIIIICHFLYMIIYGHAIVTWYNFILFYFFSKVMRYTDFPSLYSLFSLFTILPFLSFFFPSHLGLRYLIYLFLIYQYQIFLFPNILHLIFFSFLFSRLTH